MFLLITSKCSNDTFQNCLLRRLVKKLMQEKGKTLVVYNAAKYFSNIAQNSKFTFSCQNQFLQLHFISHLFYNFIKKWNDGS